MKKKPIIIAAICFVLDLLSKYFIFGFLNYGKEYCVIHKFFSIYPIKNKGAAFSFFENMNLLLISVSAIVLIYLIISIRLKKDNLVNSLSYGLLIGGLLGNLYDRIVFQSVRDFFSFTFIGYSFPIFNIADICIVLGAILIILFGFKGSVED